MKINVKIKIYNDDETMLRWQRQTIQVTQLAMNKHFLGHWIKHISEAYMVRQIDSVSLCSFDYKMKSSEAPKQL